MGLEGDHLADNWLGLRVGQSEGKFKGQVTGGKAMVIWLIIPSRIHKPSVNLWKISGKGFLLLHH